VALGNIGQRHSTTASHIDVWERWRLGGKVPGESEYEEFPRGRVMYNTWVLFIFLGGTKTFSKQSTTLTPGSDDFSVRLTVAIFSAARARTSDFFG
jgi:hypothetical protein